MKPLATPVLGGMVSSLIRADRHPVIFAADQRRNYKTSEHGGRSADRLRGLSPATYHAQSQPLHVVFGFANRDVGTWLLWASK
jgi:hypothetical protein